jgi:hypothetical protein
VRGPVPAGAPVAGGNLGGRGRGVSVRGKVAAGGLGGRGRGL